MERDKNTKYVFHNMCTQRTKRTILHSDDKIGRTTLDPKSIKAEILGYYKGLLGPQFGDKWDAKEVSASVISSKVKELCLPSMSLFYNSDF